MRRQRLETEFSIVLSSWNPCRGDQVYLKIAPLRIRRGLAYQPKVRLPVGDFDRRTSDFVRRIENSDLHRRGKARLPLDGPRQLDFPAALELRPIRGQRK